MSLQPQTHFFEHLTVLNIFGVHKKHQNPEKAYQKGKRYHPKTLILTFSKKSCPYLEWGFPAFFLKNPNPIKCGAFGRLSAVNGSPRRSGLLGVQSVPHHSIEGPEDVLRVPNPVKSCIIKYYQKYTWKKLRLISPAPLDWGTRRWPKTLGHPKSKITQLGWVGEGGWHLPYVSVTLKYY